MMNLWKLTIVIIFLQSNNNVSEAVCTHIINKTLCLDVAVCTQNVEVEYYENNGYYNRYNSYNPYNPCNSHVIDGRYALDMSLTYSEHGSDGNTNTPAVYNSRILNTIKILNISYNQYESFPILAEMKNLVNVCVSHNELTSAKLSSRYSFSHLNEMDLSYNLIQDIEINDAEYVFSNLFRLNMSHNSIAQIQDTIFSDFGHLQYLDLSYNNLDALNTVTFEGLKNLLHLNLEHNNIKEIGLSLFRCSQLQYLYLNNNEIKTLLHKDFNKLLQLKEVYLSHNAITFIENTTFDNMGHLSRIDLNHNELKTLEHNLFKDTALTEIDLSANNLQSLPKYIFKDKYITYFDLRENNLENELSKGIFEGLTDILDLDLSYQSIASLQDFAFYGLKKLQILMLNNNVLRSISEKSFHSLDTLLRLDLSHNQITALNFDIKGLVNLEHFSITSNVINSVSQFFFKGTEKLNYLDISYNNISNIIPHTFMKLSYLENLDITNNNLSSVLDEYAFEGLRALPILDISFSYVTEIKNNSFDHMISLLTLNISHSTVKEISYNSFDNTGKLQIIDLSYNLLTTFNVNLRSLNSVRILNLGHNLIATLSPISGLTMLTNINLSYNNLTMINDDSLCNLNELSYLDFSYNNNLKANLTLKNIQNIKNLIIPGISSIIEFDLSIPLMLLDMSKLNISNVSSLGITHLYNLRIVMLRNNNIQNLEMGAFKNLTQLQTLDLSFNQLRYIQPGVFKDNSYLKTLNISHNHLISVNYGIFHGLVSLNVLDISYNELEELQSERFYDIQTLRTLIADFNHISRIGLEEFSLFLSFLSIGGNPISCNDLMRFKNKYKNTKVSALKSAEVGDNIIDGVACSGRIIYKNHQNKDNINTADNILTEIRDVLISMSSKRASDNVDTETEMARNIHSTKLDMIIDSFKETKTTLQDLSLALNVSSVLMTTYLNITGYPSYNNLQNNNLTNTLLDKILQVLGTKNSSISEVHQDIKVKSTSDNLPYINKLKQEMEHSIMTQKENILSEINDKISLISKKVESVSSPKPLSDKVVQDSKLNPRLLYTEISTSLILVIFLSFTVYKIYMRVSSSRRSISTQHISTIMESSNL
ncbi:chaoptin-like [Pieris rapae]|uniref:chaoptin-like n=1 Tax=Pieris rapae TaxID=64459 RepID=UPI001E2810F9|nr:chaoptin-like [Pieris rapae]